MIAAKQTFEMKFMFFNEKLKNINFIYSADLTFRIIKVIDFNRAEPKCYRTELVFLTPVPANKVELFGT